MRPSETNAVTTAFSCLTDTRFKREHILGLLDGSLGAATTDSPDERLDLAAALAALPVELRAVVLLVDAEGLSYDAAAEVIGIAPGTVGSRLNRARAELRAALKGEAR